MAEYRREPIKIVTDQDGTILEGGEEFAPVLHVDPFDWLDCFADEDRKQFLARIREGRNTRFWKMLINGISQDVIIHIQTTDDERRHVSLVITVKTS